MNFILIYKFFCLTLTSAVVLVYSNAVNLNMEYVIYNSNTCEFNVKNKVHNID